MKKSSIFAAWCIGLFAAQSAALAGPYPDKPITIVAPFSPGGAADTVARIVGNKLGEKLGQPVIIENRVGASGAIGSAYVANATPDGYTLLVNLGPPHQTVTLFNKSVRYNPITDFTPISLLATAPQALVVPGNSSITTARELIQAAKTRPNGISYGTSGVGTSQHFAGLRLANSSEKISMTHIAYRGGSAALTDVVGGQIDAAIIVLSNALPYVASGKLRILGLVDAHRSRSAPDIPTLTEEGIPNSAVPDTWAGIMGPAKLPEDIVKKLSSSIGQVLKDQDVRKQLEKAGYDVKGSTPDEFGVLMNSSFKIYQKIVQQAGISPE